MLGWVSRASTRHYEEANGVLCGVIVSLLFAMEKPSKTILFQICFRSEEFHRGPLDTLPALNA
jgi:hypothetical protein